MNQKPIPGLGAPMPVPIHGEARVRTWDMVQEVDGMLPPDFKDWPASVTEKIYEGVELLATRIGLPLRIMHAHCEKEPEGTIFAHVIVQYIPMYVQQ
jgi:hypothetical protein